MRALLSAIAATALAMTPLAAAAQIHGGWGGGGHAMAGGFRGMGHGGFRGMGRGGFDHGFNRRGFGGERRGREFAGREGFRGERGFNRDRFGRGGFWDGGWGVGLDVGLGDYGYYGGDDYGPQDYAGLEDYGGPSAPYAGEEGYPAAYGGYDDEGGSQGDSPGRPPDCGRWVWQGGGYRWMNAECPCPPSGGYGGWGREPRG